nr:DUF3852 domain-containing protein [Flavonifractor plautii]
MRKKSIRILLLALVVATLSVVPAFASSSAGNVADAVEQTWTDAAGQIKTVVNTVVFPALTMVLGVAFFVKVAMTYFEYRKHGQFEWTGAAILFVCLIFVLLAPNYIWNIVGV